MALGREQVDLADTAACGDNSLCLSANRNVAAYTSVDKAEEEEDLANLINGDSPRAIQNPVLN